MYVPTKNVRLNVRPNEKHSAHAHKRISVLFFCSNGSFAEEAAGVKFRFVSIQLHADDIRTLARTCGSLEKQAAIVTHFVEENFMKLNAKKCEVVGFGKFGNVSCTVNGSCMTVRDVGKCLGFWWEKDFLASIVGASPKTIRPGKHSSDMAALVLFREV